MKILGTFRSDNEMEYKDPGNGPKLKSDLAIILK